MNKTFFERQQEKRRRKERQRMEALLVLILTLICVVGVIFFCFTEAEGMSQEDAYAIEQEKLPRIRGKQAEKTEIDPVYAQHIKLLKEQETADPVVPKWEVSDTADMDTNDDNFEMLVECAFAEAGNQSEYGIRLVVDVIGNRAGWDMSHVDDVITAKNQFSSYPDGMAKWRGHITEEFIQICADEWMAETKADGDLNLWYFREGHYSSYGKSWKPVGDHYFSRR